ncbi:MAG: hypothetical protein IPJ37_09440 [Bacteroidales bacterium]|nr:hypothetical protein [Bacteroidales bacterium]
MSIRIPIKASNVNERKIFMEKGMAYKLSNIKKVTPIEPVCKKAIYKSPAEAQDTIRHIKENRGVKDIRVYQCTICGFWHLTSKSG